MLAAIKSSPMEAKPDNYTVVLINTGLRKISVIKEVMTVCPGVGLADAKKLVESTPQTIKGDVSSEEAIELKMKFEALGAIIELR